MGVVRESGFPDWDDARSDPVLRDAAEEARTDARREAAADGPQPLKLFKPFLVPAGREGPYEGSMFLKGGLLVEVDAKGKVTVPTCDWLVVVPSGNPEPDSPSDCWTEVPCGARIHRHPRYAETRFSDATVCEGGHERLPLEVAWAPYGPEWEREQRDG